MRAKREKVTKEHIEEFIDLGVLNFQDMTKEEAQAELFAMAERGEPKPKPGHPLYRRWIHYTYMHSRAYDPVFHESHKKLYSEWHITVFDRTRANKERFLAMQIAGEPKPKYRTKDYILFNAYTSGKKKDNIFIKLCGEIKTNWLPTEHHDGETPKKRMVIFKRMIKQHKKRPNKDITLEGFLRNITQEYPRYFKELKELCIKERVAWFKGQRAIFAKEDIICMAKNGENRPHYTSDLGKLLSQYTCKGCKGGYDPIFDKKIRKLAPHWFRKGRK